MSRKSVLSTPRTRHVCERCGEEISHDVVRIDEGRLYHLSCFRMLVPGPEIGILECPQCHTMGRYWDWTGKAWRECTACGGGGYLADPGEACGN